MQYRVVLLVALSGISLYYYLSGADQGVSQQPVKEAGTAASLPAKRPATSPAPSPAATPSPPPAMPAPTATPVGKPAMPAPDATKKRLLLAGETKHPTVTCLSGMVMKLKPVIAEADDGVTEINIREAEPPVKWTFEDASIARIEEDAVHCLKAGSTPFGISAEKQTIKGTLEVVDAAIRALEVVTSRHIRVGQQAESVWAVLTLTNKRRLHLYDASLSLADNTLAELSTPLPGISMIRAKLPGQVDVCAQWQGRSSCASVNILPYVPLPVLRIMASRSSRVMNSDVSRPFHLVLGGRPLWLGGWQEKWQYPPAMARL